jgi:hypothetical protein
MRKLAIFLALTVTAMTAAFAQSADTRQPKPKSQKEAEAINAVFSAQDPDARIAAVEALLTKYADTQFKGIALYVATVSAQQKNDSEKIVLYGERTLEADPKGYGAMLIMGQALAARTREFDFDKEEKLGKAEKLAKEALALVATAPKPNPAMTDEQWAMAKKDFESQGHEVLGLSAMVRKKYDVAIPELKAAIEAQPQKDPSTMVRLAVTYNDAGQPDNAIAMVDQLNAMPDLPPSIKQVAAQQKLKAVQLKSQKK